MKLAKNVSMLGICEEYFQSSLKPPLCSIESILPDNPAQVSMHAHMIKQLIQAMATNQLYLIPPRFTLHAAPVLPQFLAVLPFAHGTSKWQFNVPLLALL